MKRTLPFPPKPAEVCPSCGTRTVHTNQYGDKFCSLERCTYRRTRAELEQEAKPQPSLFNRK